MHIQLLLLHDIPKDRIASNKESCQTAPNLHIVKLLVRVAQNPKSPTKIKNPAPTMVIAPPHLSFINPGSRATPIKFGLQYKNVSHRD